MKHITAIIIKFVMVAVILEIVLGLTTALNFKDILLISIAVTVVAYLIGDLLVLSLSNNTVATIVDAILALATIYMFNYYYPFGTIDSTAAVFAALFIGVGEIFFHKFMAAYVFPNRTKKI